MIKYVLSFLAILWASYATMGQQYETVYSRGSATVKLTNNVGQYVFQTDRLLSGFNRGAHAFIYKLPSDSIFAHWTRHGFPESNPFEEDFVEIIVKTKSNPVDFDNFDGEDLNLECEIVIDGTAYNETALFRGYFNPSDKMISTSFRILLDLSHDNYPQYSANESLNGSLEIMVDDGFVSVRNEL